MFVFVCLVPAGKFIPTARRLFRITDPAPLDCHVVAVFVALAFIMVLFDDAMVLVALMATSSNEKPDYLTALLMASRVSLVYF